MPPTCHPARLRPDATQPGGGLAGQEGADSSIGTRTDFVPTRGWGGGCCGAPGLVTGSLRSHAPLFPDADGPEYTQSWGAESTPCAQRGSCRQDCGQEGWESKDKVKEGGERNGERASATKGSRSERTARGLRWAQHLLPGSSLVGPGEQTHPSSRHSPQSNDPG